MKLQLKFPENCFKNLSRTASIILISRSKLCFCSHFQTRHDEENELAAAKIKKNKKRKKIIELRLRNSTTQQQAVSIYRDEAKKVGVQGKTLKCLTYTFKVGSRKTLALSALRAAFALLLLLQESVQHRLCSRSVGFQVYSQFLLLAQKKTTPKALGSLGEKLFLTF